MKKILMLLLVISVIFTGCAKGDDTAASIEEEKNGQKQTKEEEITYIRVEPVSVMDFYDVLSLPGTLIPQEEVMITAKVNGMVNDVVGDMGQKVSKGQTLCKIDDTLFKLQYNKASAGLNAEKIKYDNLQKTYERMKVLYESQALSQSEFENIESQLHMEKEQLKLMESDYTLASENLAYTNVKSPISGIISEKNVLVGESIGPGSRLFTVVGIDSLYVEIGVAEKDVGIIKTGQKVTMKIDALGGKKLEGSISHVGPVSNSESKTYPVKVSVKNSDGTLKPGMFATVEIMLNSHKGVLGVSKDAIMNENGMDYVFVEKSGKAYRKNIKVGTTDEKYVEVTEGLNKEDKVIVVGKESLKDGSIVEVK
ncbi:MAG: efflux RND transporter periplasmic adaptor subunit [Bacillota bacterium]